MERNLIYFTGASLILSTTIIVYFISKKRQRRHKWSKIGKDVVLLHQFHRPSNGECPNISPFAVKIETFLRITGIPYVIDNEEPFGPVGKCPWITLNGENIIDSELILIRIKEHFDKELNGKYDEERLAIGRAVQVMLDEHAAWGQFLKRYVYDEFKYVFALFPPVAHRIPFVFQFLLKRGMKRRSAAQGMGRLEQKQVMMFVERDFKVVSSLIGEKRYLLGDEISEFDCCVFGHLVQMIYCNGPEMKYLVEKKYENLLPYFNRIKDQYWKDWNEGFNKDSLI